MGYRFSNEFIERWEKRLIWSLCIGVTAAFALAGGGLLVGDALDVEKLGSATSWVIAGVIVLGLVIGAVAVVGSIALGAILGGLALHPLGWIPGLLLATWMFGGIALWGLGGGLGFLLYVLGFAPIVAAFIWMGRKAKVPVYLRSAAPGSPRLYLSEGEDDSSGTRHERDPDRGDTDIEDAKSP